MSITTASVFLIGPDVFSHIDVSAPEGEAPLARGDIFVAGYDCVTEDAADATINGLDSARRPRARRVLPMPPGPTRVTGPAVGRREQAAQLGELASATDQAVRPRRQLPPPRHGVGGQGIASGGPDRSLRSTARSSATRPASSSALLKRR